MVEAEYSQYPQYKHPAILGVLRGSMSIELVNTASTRSICIYSLHYVSTLNNPFGTPVPFWGQTTNGSVVLKGISSSSTSVALPDSSLLQLSLMGPSVNAF